MLGGGGLLLGGGGLLLGGVGAYVIALLNLSAQSDLYFDIGNATLLFDIALMLVVERLERRE